MLYLLEQCLNGIQLGMLLFFNELVRLIWGPAGLTLSLPPEMLSAVQVCRASITRSTGW